MCKNSDRTYFRDQAIQIKSLNKSYYFMSALKTESITKRKDVYEWYESFKRYCTLLNLKSYYEIGNLLGKGNFARVYEAMKFNNGQKYALKTIEKKTLSSSKRNFVITYW